jgi:hypothetical protein
MKNIFKWFLVTVFFIVFVFFLVTKQNNSTSILISDVQVSPQVKSLDINKIQHVKIAGVTLKVDLALTSEAQEQGLSGRSGLKEDQGMLFVFDHMDKYPFWMKDMNFPIDIIWIGEDLRVVYIKKSALPESYPETFTPNQNAKYVLEVMSSFSEKNNLKVGDKVEFLPS